MTVWIIEPRDPFIARDGRPFGLIPGARAASYDFPFPSTTTGGVRTRHGLGIGGNFDDEQQKPRLIAEVRRIGVRGPLLVEIGKDPDDVRWLASAPADAALFEVETVNGNIDRYRAEIKVLEPRGLPDDADTNLPEGLMPICPTLSDQRKPCGNAPRYWTWQRFEQWLINPVCEQVDLTELGHNGPVSETRTHVKVQPGTWTAADGALFQTRGLEFTLGNKHASLSARRLAFGIATDATGITPGLAPLGGERRLVNWHKSRATLPECPPLLRETIIETGACRIVLLTPAHFKEGSRPQWLVGPQCGISPELIAMAATRTQVVSGWDFEINKPKPTRRLVPPGAVFFLRLDGDPSARNQWIDMMWMACVSDDEQDRRDGFGLAVLGSWSGVCPKMEVQR
jgi:CRISPR-associated protein Cmr3